MHRVYARAFPPPHSRHARPSNKLGFDLSRFVLGSGNDSNGGEIGERFLVYFHFLLFFFGILLRFILFVVSFSIFVFIRVLFIYFIISYFIFFYFVNLTFITQRSFEGAGSVALALTGRNEIRYNFWGIRGKHLTRQLSSSRSNRSLVGLKSNKENCRIREIIKIRIRNETAKEEEQKKKSKRRRAKEEEQEKNSKRRRAKEEEQRKWETANHKLINEVRTS
jgi:hypothetical protein